MSRNILKLDRGFSLAELLSASFVSTLAIVAALSIYMMGWSWWHETMPQAEAQRAVRTAINSIVNGLSDPSCGSDTVNAVSYTRKNGLTWATSVQSPAVGESGSLVSFDLAGAANQSFFLDSANEKICHNTAGNFVKGTYGITSLDFERLDTDLIRVTAGVDKYVPGTRQVPYHVRAFESETIYLRNYQ